MSSDGTRLRWILGLAAITGAYAGWVFVTGGVDTDVLGMRVRSRGWERPAAVGFLIFLCWVALVLRRSPHSAARAWAWMTSTHAAAMLTAGAILWTAVAGWRYGTFVAGGSDSYCYISQAHLIEDGTLTDVVHMRPEFTWRDAELSLIPLGYRTASSAQRIAPVCPPGLSLLMAAAAVFGERAMYALIPLFGVAVALATSTLGRRLGAPLAGGLAALFAALSATFLLMLFAPMSDVPITALWVGVLAVASAQGRVPSLLAGILAGVAVLTRPNLGPLVFAVAILFTARDRRRQFVFFLVPVVVAVGALLWIQHRRFGAFFQSGYGDTSDLFSLVHVAPNARSYASRLSGIYTPMIWLWVLGGFVAWRRAQRPLVAAVVCTIVGVWLSYLAYQPFEPWFFTRFLLPAIPLMLLLALIAALALVDRLPLWIRPSVVAVCVVAMAFALVDGSRRLSVFTSAAIEKKYPLAAGYVRQTLPSESYVLARQHSGSVRFYAGRPTLRWDVLGGDQLDFVVDRLRAIGAAVYLVADDDEMTPFASHFAGQASISRLRQLAVFGQARVYAIE